MTGENSHVKLLRMVLDGEMISSGPGRISSSRLALSPMSVTAMGIKCRTRGQVGKTEGQGKHEMDPPISVSLLIGG